jgi:hypothetical protein
VIEQGWAGDVSLDGFAVALAMRYHDDEPGSPWRFVLYVDVRADGAQRDALAGIYTGQLGGDALKHFPWAWKTSELAAVRPVEIEVSHQPRRQWLRIGDRVSVTIREAYRGTEVVTCVIPGHETSGEELITDLLSVDDGGLRFEYSGNCGYAAPFDYRG